jgi:hypothetical protein
MQNAISVTTALFDAKIAPSEVQYLRGNMIKMSDYSPLFHNHSAEGYRYATLLYNTKGLTVIFKQAMISKNSYSMGLPVWHNP